MSIDHKAKERYYNKRIVTLRGITDYIATVCSYHLVLEEFFY